MNKELPSLVEYDASKTSNLFEFIVRNFREIIIYRHALVNFVSTILSTRYRRSTFGFFWSLLNPLFTMSIISVVFSSLNKLPFSEFSMYLFSGMLPWNLITSSLLGGAMSIVNNEVYLKKVYLPKILFPLVSLGVELFNFFFSMISLFVLAIFLGAKLSLNTLLVFPALFLLACFLLGLIMFLSVLNVYFRDLFHILQIGLLGLFYLTPILYPLSFLSTNVQSIIKFNPFYYFIILFQAILYNSSFPTIHIWMPCLALAVISLFVGIIILQKRENDLVYRL